MKLLTKVGSKNTWNHNYFGLELFLNQNNFWPKLFLDPEFFYLDFFVPKFLGSNSFNTEFFWTQTFLTSNFYFTFFYPNYFDPLIFGTTFLWTHISLSNFILDANFCGPTFFCGRNVFCLNIFWIFFHSKLRKLYLHSRRTK